ncbi:MAG TPA: DUF1653 domain-containing protein [Candidatus Paceibacterota bacterium]|nr:DUF1653 domain-containing protein [Candidatus Paceibacterota bacterium]
MEPIPGIYYHFKDPDKLYEVIGIAFNTETGEDMVVYKPLYEGAPAPLCVRPRSMFIEEVDRPDHNYRGPRFVYVREA